MLKEPCLTGRLGNSVNPCGVGLSHLQKSVVTAFAAQSNPLDCRDRTLPTDFELQNEFS